LHYGLRFLGSYYLAIRDGQRFCWSQHVCAPYLTKPDAAWFDGELPVVGYFHDYELAIDGVQWMVHWLDQWEQAGARRFIDYRELAAAVDRRFHLERGDNGLHLSITSDGAPALVRPLTVAIRAPEQLPTTISVSVDGLFLDLEVQDSRDGRGFVVLPKLEEG
jgi:hypothetical protein